MILLIQILLRLLYCGLCGFEDKLKGHVAWSFTIIYGAYVAAALKPVGRGANNADAGLHRSCRRRPMTLPRLCHKIATSDVFWNEISL